MIIDEAYLKDYPPSPEKTESGKKTFKFQYHISLKLIHFESFSIFLKIADFKITLEIQYESTVSVGACTMMIYSEDINNLFE